MQAHHHARAAGQGHGHDVTWLHASLHQAAGGRIHLGVEAGVVQALVLHAQGLAAGVLPAGLTHQGHQRGVRHRVGGVVDAGHPVAQLLVVQGLHGAQGIGLQGGTQEGQQACRVPIDLLGGVEARVGFHLQAHAAGIGRSAHVQVEVFHGSGAVDDLVGIQTGLAVGRVEGQDVEQRPMDAALPAGASLVAAHLFAAVAAVAACLLQLACGLDDQLIQWPVLVHVQYQRHDVHDGGHAAGAGVAQAAHPRHAGHHRLLADVALHVGGQQHGQHVGPAHQRLLFLPVQGLQHVLGHVDLGMQRVIARGGAAFGEAADGVQRRQQFAPVGGVGRTLRTVAVAGIVGNHGGKGGQGRPGQRTVVLHGPLLDQRHAIAVGRQVVDALEPQHRGQGTVRAVRTCRGGEADQQMPGQRRGARIDGGAQVGLHQALGLGAARRIAGQCQALQHRTSGGVEILAWAVLGVDQGQRQCIGLVQGSFDGAGQPFHVHLTADGGAVACVEDRVARIQLLRVPEPFLGFGQRHGAGRAVHGRRVVVQGGRHEEGSFQQGSREGSAAKGERRKAGQ